VRTTGKIRWVVVPAHTATTTTADVYELSLTRDGRPVTLDDLILDVMQLPILPNNRHDRQFGQTSDGEIYVMTKQDETIRQLVGPGLPGDYNGNGVVDAAAYPAGSI
jgi:hypothetical protein